ncbi:MAG: DNA cytosine methyltransferase [Flavobacteriales bacterium]
MQNLKIDWVSSDTFPKKGELKAFGTFVCGGGSTMGYKLAGFDHLGGVEIDKNMADIYETNHIPKYFYKEDIRVFNERKDLPNELYELDVLDGSPPCSTFSMAGSREKSWGKEKQFREGQSKQCLDELVYVYCDTIKKLQPKVAILENVTGIVSGKAKKYTIGIYDKLEKAGYYVQIFKLNAATMGVPQARERIFFIARRKDLGFEPLVLKFNEKPVYFGDIADTGSTTHKEMLNSTKLRWKYVTKGDESLKYANRIYTNNPDSHSFFSTSIVYNNTVHGTLTSGGTSVYYHEERRLNDTEYRRMSTFPKDFDFRNVNVRYVCGMSVPPLMIARIANEIKKQWFE